MSCVDVCIANSQPSAPPEHATGVIEDTCDDAEGYFDFKLFVQFVELGKSCFELENMDQFEAKDFFTHDYEDEDFFGAEITHGHVFANAEPRSFLPAVVKPQVASCSSGSPFSAMRAHCWRMLCRVTPPYSILSRVATLAYVDFGLMCCARACVHVYMCVCVRGHVCHVPQIRRQHAQQTRPTHHAGATIQ